MRADPVLELLLSRWEDLRDRGDQASIEELCHDYPEHREEFRRLLGRLERLDQLLSTSPLDREVDSGRHGSSSLRAASTPTSYRVTRFRARGGIGEVFVARDETLGRDVALKLIQGHLGGDPDRSGRFVREAEITSRLEHPGIVPVYGIGHGDDGRPCYAMRLIEGETLQAAIARVHEAGASDRDVRRDTRLRPLLSRLVAVCNAVAYAHTQGVIHRDLKPSNVMLGPFNETIVVDWGLAKQSSRDQEEGASRSPEAPAVGDDDEWRTRTGSTLGTLAYMSPEQADGRWAEVGPASDIYSLGATLYHVLTGRAPFRGRRFEEVIAALRRGEFPRPRAVDSRVPPNLEAICLKAMALRPSDRYATALDLAADLERWLAGEPTTAWRESWSIRFGRWVRRHKPVAVGTGVLVVSAVVALSISTFLLGHEQQKTAHALARAEETLVDLQVYSGLSADEQGHPARAALWFAKAAETSRADSERDRFNRIRAWAWLRPLTVPVHAFPNPGRAQRGLVFHPRGRYLLAKMGETANASCKIWSLDTAREIPLPEGASQVGDAAWRPDGTRLALGLPRGGALVYRFPEGTLIDRLDCPGPVTALAYSPDGQYLALAGAKLRIWDDRSRRFILDSNSHRAEVARLTFNPQGDRLASVGTDGLARIYGIPAGSRIPLAEFPNTGPYDANATPLHPAFTRDGRRVWTLARSDLLVCRDATTGGIVRTIPRPSGWSSFDRAETSPDRQYIAVTGSGGVQIRDTESGDLLSEADRREDLSPSFSPDGRILLTGSSQQFCQLSSVPDGLPLGPMIKHQDLVIQTAFAPDGRSFATAQGDGLVRVWRIGQQDPRNRTISTGKDTCSFALSVDGRYVMPTGRTLTHGPFSTSVTELETGKAFPAIPTDGVLHGGAFSPDGRSVVILSSPPCPDPSIREYRYPSGSQPGSFRAWDFRTARPLYGPVPCPSEPIGVAFRPDGRRAAVVLAAGQVLLFDPANGRVLGQGPHGGTLNAGLHPPGFVRFARDGRAFVTYGIGGLAHVWDGDEGRPRLASLEHKGICFDADFSPDGRYVLTAGLDKVAQVWDGATGRPSSPPLNHPDWVFAARFSPDGRYVLTACRDRSARLWDWRTARLACPPLVHDDEIKSVGFLAGGHYLITGGHDRAVRLWEGQTGKPLTPALAFDGAALQVEVTPDGSYLVAAGHSESVHAFFLQGLLSPPANLATVGHLLLKAEIVAGQSVHRGGGLVNLTSAEWLGRWEDFRRLDRDVPPTTPPISFEADRHAVRSQDGRRHFALGEWELAATSYGEALELQPESLPLWHELACTQMRLGKIDEYRRLCGTMLQRFENDPDPYAAYWVARVCTLSPGALEDPERAVRLAGRAAASRARGERSAEAYWYRRILAATTYRAGRYDQAITRLGESLDSHPMGRAWAVYDWLWLAMAHARLGHSVEARRLMETFNGVIGHYAKDTSEASILRSTWPWEERMEYQILRSEAEAVTRETFLELPIDVFQQPAP